MHFLALQLTKAIFLLPILFTGSMLHAQHTITIKHAYYTMLFDTVQSAERIGFYVQTTAHAQSTTKIKREGRFNDFTVDPTPALKNKVLANDGAYKDWNKAHPKQPRDRGHINPYAAFDFDSIAALQTNYFSNTCPQAKRFNEHQWEAVEAFTKQLAKGKYDSANNQYTVKPIDSINVWTGVLISTAHIKKMGKIPMPDYYWKLIEYKLNGKIKKRAWLGANSDKNLSTNPDDIVATVGHLKKVIKQYYPKMKVEF